MTQAGYGITASPQITICYPLEQLQKLGIEAIIDYGCEGPSIGSNQIKEITINLKNHSTEDLEGVLELQIPDGWTGSENYTF